jgi:dihydroxyacid dehydratase/phosphogluconate dehydratase
MEEFYYSGGLPAVIRRMGEASLLPHPQALTVNGQTIWEVNNGWHATANTVPVIEL